MRVIVRADDTTVFLCSVLSEMGSVGRRVLSFDTNARVVEHWLNSAWDAF